jgi:hypothetical protein
MRSALGVPVVLDGIVMWADIHSGGSLSKTVMTAAGANYHRHQARRYGLSVLVEQV